MGTDFLNIAGIFKTNTGLFKKTIEGVPTEKLLARPGDDSNHMLWIAGHVVVHRAKVLRAPGSGMVSSVGRAVRPRRQVDRCQKGTRGSTRWSRPGMTVSGRLAPSLANASSEALAEPVAKGITLDGKISGQIAFLALHETYHVGQMAYLRKWLGCGQAVG